MTQSAVPQPHWGVQSPTPQNYNPPFQPTEPVTQALPLQVQQPTTQSGHVQQPAPLHYQALPFSTQPQVQQQPQLQPAVQPPPQPQFQQQPQPQPPPQQVAAVQADEAPTILALLRSFAKQPGCERYDADAEKVKLLELYLFIRQLTPSLSFELFLTLFAPFADADETNLKHPADSIRRHLPRTKKQAEEQGTTQWTSKSVVDYVSLYVDVIRCAEAASSPVPMDFNTFLTNQVMLEQFHAGAFKEVASPKTKVKAAKATAEPKQRTPKLGAAARVTPTAAGQRVIYTSGSGRQFRGELTAYWQDPGSMNTFADFRADSGEEFKGSGIGAFEICNDPQPNAPQTLEGDPLPELGAGKIIIPKLNGASVQQALAMNVPVGTVAVGDVLYTYSYQFPGDITATIDIANGATGPYVDGYLWQGAAATNVIAEINPPRKNAAGTYIFETPVGTYRIEVEVHT